MALQIPHAGLQLEEDFSDANAHLPTQSFILDLGDDVIDGMIEAANAGQEIRLSLGNKPTFSYGSSSHRVEPAFEDETDDIELFLTNPTTSSARAERLPQLAMSLFRKPELGYTYPYYKTTSDEEEEEEGEYYEVASSPEADESDQPSQQPHQSDVGLDTDIAALRDSMMQREAEKHEKSARVIEGSAHTSNAKPNTTKRSAGSLQKALSGRRSPFGRGSLSPSPALSTVGSPSLAPADASSQQAAEKARQSRSPIIHELAFKEQSYHNLWNKYPGSSEAEFRSALDKVADLDDETHLYILRKKYWRELDVWRHDYASDEERQRAVDNAIRQFDKMRLSTAEPEWEKLLPHDKRGQGLILSKVQVSIAKGTVAPKIRVQKPDESNTDSNANDSGENGSGSNRTDEEGGESEHSPTRQGAMTGVGAKKKMSAREAQEKRLLSTKKKSTPTSAPSAAAASSSASNKVSPVKSSAATAAAAAAARATNANQSKFKSKEFVSDSDSDSESESAPLAASVHQSKLAASTVKSSSSTSAAKAAAANKGVPASIIKERLAQKEREAERSTPPASAARKAKPSPVKELVRPQANTKPLPKKRSRDSDDDDDSSSGSSSATPLSKRIKPTKSAPKLPSTLRDSRDKYDAQPTSSSRLPPPSSQRPRASNVSPNGSSSSSSGNNGSHHSQGITNGAGGSKLKKSSSTNGNGGGNGSSNGNGNSNSYGHTSSARDNHNSNVSPTKSSPLASSPPTNASELDLSSEESVPPIGSSNTARKRKMVEASSNAYSGSKVKKHAHSQRALPDDLVAKAQRFKTLYEKYAALYKDIASRNNPPKERVNDLLKMHRRLEALKRDINEEVTMCD